MKCIGVDLGWQSQPSGLCCLEFQQNALYLKELARLDSIASILNWIETHLSPQDAGIIAVDAPTLIPNPTGMRLPDRLTHKFFGRYHAGCYPANLGRPFAERTVGFGQSLVERGFLHAPTIEPQRPGRYQIEVFPHPATIHLFRLDRILKYKKGKQADRQAELIRLRQFILDVLPNLDLPLKIAADQLPEVPPRGTPLKILEDQLDSLVCAYVAAHWWFWGLDRNWVLGDAEQGYIVVPAPLAQAAETVP